MIKSDSISKLVVALNGARKMFKPVVKDKENTFFKVNGRNSRYADLANVIAATEEGLSKFGISIIQLPVSEEGRAGVLTIIAHESGEFLGEQFTLPIGRDKHGNQNAQLGVATVTYARRSALQGAVNVAAEDDDGNTAAGNYEVYDEDPLSELPPPRPTRQVADAINAEDRGSRPAPPETEPLPVEAAFGEHPEPAPKRTRKPRWDGPAGPTMPQPGVLPTEDQLEVYRGRMQKLAETLSTAGLKASRNLMIGRKVLLYLLTATGSEDATKISVPEWDAFFDFTDKMASLDNGNQQLAALVDASSKKPKEE